MAADLLRGTRNANACQVLAALDALGCGCSHSTALVQRLERDGFDPAAITVAVNAALAEGVLVLDACIRKA